jgi:hypothetical protein
LVPRLVQENEYLILNGAVEVFDPVGPFLEMLNFLLDVRQAGAHSGSCVYVDGLHSLSELVLLLLFGTSFFNLSMNVDDILRLRSGVICSARKLVIAGAAFFF